MTFGRSSRGRLTKNISVITLLYNVNLIPNCRCVYRDTFRGSDIVIETGFIENNSHSTAADLACESLPPMTLMVAIVYFNPRVVEGGEGSTNNRDTYII